MIKIVFFGTPRYVIPIVEELNRKFKNSREKGLVAVVTQPPKPAGRENKIVYSEVDHWAHKRNLPVIFDLDEVPEADIAVVASYGSIIPQSVIDKFKYGLLNIHPSLLPKFRGASPVQSTIVSGETQTGLTIIKMDNKLDHGPIVSSFKEEIKPDDTSESLRNRLFLRSANFITEMIPNYIDNKIKTSPQNHEKATFCSQIKKQDAFINPLYLNKVVNGKVVNKKMSLQFIKESSFDINPEFVERFVRAMIEWPIAWTFVKLDNNSDSPKRLKILKAHCENNKLVLDKVQLEGKNEVSWKQFIEGYPNYSFEE